MNSKWYLYLLLLSTILNAQGTWQEIDFTKSLAKTRAVNFVYHDSKNRTWYSTYDGLFCEQNGAFSKISGLSEDYTTYKGTHRCGISDIRECVNGWVLFTQAYSIWIDTLKSDAWLLHDKSSGYFAAFDGKKWV
jgi:hypothetical protein